MATGRTDGTGGRAARRRIGVLVAAAALAAAVWAGQASGPPDRGGPRRAAPAEAPSPARAPGTAAAAAAVDGPRRPVPAAAPAPRTFADYVDELVAIGERTSALVVAGDTAAADESDEGARRLFDEMMARLPDAEAEALAALCATPAPAAPALPGLEVPAPAPPQGDRDAMRRRVWNLALAAGLHRRHERALRGADRGPLDSLVAAALTALPAAEDLAVELGCGQLADRPYLHLAHEAAVLELVALSGTGGFPPAVATALLSTLWRNLQASGDRSGAELRGLALLLLRDGNASERASAARLLLGEDRFRAVVLEHLRRNADARLLREVAVVAAQDLPPPLALEVLQTTVHLGEDFAAPFLVLGFRDAALLADRYEQQLADGTEPALREALVGGVGFAGGPRGVATAQLAFDHDPDPGVRLKALYVLTANAGAACGERTVAAALDDPRIRDDPLRLGAVVLALENLADQGLINELDRLGQRLRTCGALTADARAHLERILARALPHGGR